VTLRDRLVLTAVIMLAVIGAAWVLVVSPERKQASELTTQLTTAKAQLSGAESKLSSAREAQARYSSAYASIVSVGKAVPTSQEVPSLIYQLSQVSKQKSVAFQSITVGAGNASASSAASAAAAAASTGFAQFPFTFVFSGSYFGLEHMLRQLTDLATITPAGTLQVNGRLLTVQSVRLAADTEAASKHGLLTATITATAYQLPAEPLTASAAPAGASAVGSAGAATSPTAPAIVKVR
jgi:Tfp pilus assembly protein PilO